MSDTGGSEGLTFLRQFIRPGDLCFDVGANCGDKTALMLEAGANVICLEPQSACVSTLKSRFSGEPRVTIVQAAAGAEPGELLLRCCTEATTISTMSERWVTGRFSGYTWDGSEVVEVVTLDSLVDRFGVPRLCKIDVEGYERTVLDGLNIAPDYVSFEFTEEFFDDAMACTRRLSAIGMTGFNFALDETPGLQLPDWVDGTALEGIVVSHFAGDCWGDIYARSAGAHQSDESAGDTP